MCICSFIGFLKLTNCNYVKFSFSFIGIHFAFSKLVNAFLLIKRLNWGQKMPEVFRKFPERRTGKDRRRIFGLHRYFYKGFEKRKALQDRRSPEERRDGWVKIDKWSSVNLHNLKISKYLK
jgi:hypothetical protein